MGLIELMNAMKSSKNYDTQAKIVQKMHKDGLIAKTAYNQYTSASNSSNSSKPKLEELEELEEENPYE